MEQQLHWSLVVLPSTQPCSMVGCEMQVGNREQGKLIYFVAAVDGGHRAIKYSRIYGVKKEGASCAVCSTWRRGLRNAENQCTLKERICLWETSSEQSTCKRLNPSDRFRGSNIPLPTTSARSRAISHLLRAQKVRRAARKLPIHIRLIIIRCTDLQMVNITCRVLSRPSIPELATIYRELGTDYDERVLPSIVNEVLKSVIAQFNASQRVCMRSTNTVAG